MSARKSGGRAADGARKRADGTEDERRRDRAPTRAKDAAPARASRAAPRVRIVHPTPKDAAAFVDAARASRALHGRWVSVPLDRVTYGAWLATRHGPRSETFLVRRIEDDALAGVVSLVEITRGALQSATVGFYGFVPHHGQGNMTEGLRLVLRHAFGILGLHRVEAAIQPRNERSRALAARCGFVLEGFSPRYLKIRGRWRDHERWAVLAEDWR